MTTIIKAPNTQEPTNSISKPLAPSLSTTPPSTIQPHPQSKTKPPVKSQTKKPNQKTLARIKTHPTLTSSRRLIYTTLLTIPPGRWTTYSALAKHLNTSPRAIGNAMRANPFAPEVPCHRVLAADGSLGGYKGEWVVDARRLGDGSFGGEKRGRLLAEGVRFDGRGRAVGVPFVGFG